MTTSSLTVTELAADDVRRWDAFVEGCSEATFFHRAGWRTVIEDAFGHPTHFLMAADAGGVRGVLPLVHIRSRLFGNALLSSAFAVYGGPAAADEPARRALDARAAALAEELGVDYLEYRCRRRLHPDWPAKELYATFRRPLDPDPERNFLAIPRKQRAVVRQALKAGLEAVVEDDARIVWRLYARNVHAHGTPALPERYFRLLKRVFGDACELLTVRKDGAAVAGCLTFRFRDEVMPYYAGSGEGVRRYGGHDFMYWDIMRRACLAGARVFDFGRSKKGTGPYAFKKNWGFDPEPLPYEYRLVRARAVPDVNPLNPRYRMFVEIWKRLPLPVASRMGPLLARSLG